MLLADGLDSPSHVFGYFQEHIARLAGVNVSFVFLIFLVGIFFRLLESQLGHLILGFAYHRRIQLLIREKVVQIDITDHRCLQECFFFFGYIRVITDEHMAGHPNEDRFDIDSPQQGCKEHATIYAVDLRGLQSIIEGAHTLGENDIAGQAGIGYRAVAELSFLQYIPKSIHLSVHRILGTLVT